jgi:hypothetical protein
MFCGKEQQTMKMLRKSDIRSCKKNKRHVTDFDYLTDFDYVTDFDESVLVVIHTTWSYTYCKGDFWIHSMISFSKSVYCFGILLPMGYTSGCVRRGSTGMRIFSRRRTEHIVQKKAAA